MFPLELLSSAVRDGKWTKMNGITAGHWRDAGQRSVQQQQVQKDQQQQDTDTLILFLLLL